MPVYVTSREEWGTLHLPVYSDREIEEAWYLQSGQGKSQAQGRGSMCVVKKIKTHDQALALSRVFLSKFNIPTCLHFDGRTLSMYCGDAGSGFSRLRDYLEQVEVT